MYRPPSFDKLTISLSKAVNKFDNLIVMRDFNIDIAKEDCLGFDKLEEFCDTFDLTNLIKCQTCYTNNRKLTIDPLFHE